METPPELTNPADQPVVVVPKDLDAPVAEMFGQPDVVAKIRGSTRAASVGVLAFVRRDVGAAALVDACAPWAGALRDLGVATLAVLLSVQAYAQAQSIFGHCIAALERGSVRAQFFHEAMLKTDDIRAWFERRAPNPSVTRDDLLRLRDELTARGDEWAAYHAELLANRVDR